MIYDLTNDDEPEVQFVSALSAAVTTIPFSSRLEDLQSIVTDFRILRRESSEQKQSKKKKTKKSNCQSSHQLPAGFGGREGESLSANHEVDKKRHEEMEKDKKVATLFHRLRSVFECAERECWSNCQRLQAYKVAGLTLSPIGEFLGEYLRNDSLQNIGLRSECYKELFRFISCILRDEMNGGSMISAPFLQSSSFSSACGMEQDDSKRDHCDRVESCLLLLETLNAQASVFVKLHLGSLTNGLDDMMIENLAIALLIQQTYEDGKRMYDSEWAFGLLAKSDKDNKREKTVEPVSSSTTFSSIISTAFSVAKSVLPSSYLGSSSAVPSSSVDPSDSESEYLRVLRPMRFESIDLLGALSLNTTTHTVVNAAFGNIAKFEASPINSSVIGRSRMVRIAHEISTLVSSLPVEFGSSIFVRCDESRVDLLKALIIGPTNTPYENGCFEFDILLPEDYPNAPPKCLLATTGRGTVRFNPNLYNCGKVCLSLLGTWAGPGWDPVNSTLLQVLVSIQSLILVTDPYFNEPGHPYRVNSAESLEYNKIIMVNTIRWAMLDQLKNKTSIFADVIHEHFRLKRHTIDQQIEKWTKSLSKSAEYKKIAKELSILILKLSTPAPSLSTNSGTAFPPSYSGSTGIQNIPQKRLYSDVKCYDLSDDN